MQMLEVSRVSKVFGGGDTAFHALKNVSVKIPEKSSVAIVGKSGSGKSTLMHIMSGLDHATSGKVIFDGVNITDMRPKQADSFRAKSMSFIFQSFFVEANRSAIDNVMLPLEISKFPRGQRIAKAENALEAVDLLDKRNEKARNLSGGQKQRLAVARAVVNEPKLLFADEPTGNLDSHTSGIVENLLFDISKRLGSILIIVTHDKDLAKKCDIQIHLKDGEIESVEGIKVKKGKK